MTMVRILTGLFLMAHGLVHLMYLLPRPPDDASYPFVPETRWSAGVAGLAPGAAKSIAATLGVAVAFSLLIAGVALFVGSDAWMVSAAAGSVLSLLLLLLFFHPWLSIGVAIDVAILASLWFAHVPGSLFERA